jgi:hypothetical protein
MENPATFSELRELLKVAKQLRAAAADTCDDSYVSLFLRTAVSLEDYARNRAFGSIGDAAPRVGHYFPEFMCISN